MAYVPMHYTTGNWTVDEKWAITPTTTYGAGEKSITVSNFNFETDFTYVGQRPAQNKNDPPLECYNATTNTTPSNNCQLSLGSKRINDIYSGLTGKNAPFEKVPVYKLANHSGTQIQVRLDTLVWASNSVSAEEGDLPASGWMVFKLINHPAVTVQFIRHFAKHLCGVIENMDDTTLAGLIEAAIEGDLNPTR